MRGELLKVGDIITTSNYMHDTLFEGQPGILLSVMCNKVVSALELRRAHTSTKFYYGRTTLCSDSDGLRYSGKWRLDMLKLYDL